MTVSSEANCGTTPIRAGYELDLGRLDARQCCGLCCAT